MNKSTLLILILAGALLVSLFFHVEQNEISEAYRLEKEQAQRHIKKQIDSVNRVIQAKDKAILKAMIDVREAEVRVEIAEEKAVKIKAKYDQIRRVTTVDDNQRDSLLESILN